LTRYNRFYSLLTIGQHSHDPTYFRFVTTI
jgi:hypothetical protein